MHSFICKSQRGWRFGMLSNSNETIFGTVGSASNARRPTSLSDKSSTRRCTTNSSLSRTATRGTSFGNGTSLPSLRLVCGRKICGTLMKAAGLWIKGNLSHRFRDTAVDFWLGQGWSLTDVADALGDTVAVVERHYKRVWRASEAKSDWRNFPCVLGAAERHNEQHSTDCPRCRRHSAVWRRCRHPSVRKDGRSH